MGSQEKLCSGNVGNRKWTQVPLSCPLWKRLDLNCSKAGMRLMVRVLCSCPGEEKVYTRESVFSPIAVWSAVVPVCCTALLTTPGECEFTDTHTHKQTHCYLGLETLRVLLVVVQYCFTSHCFVWSRLCTCETLLP